MLFILRTDVRFLSRVPSLLVSIANSQPSQLTQVILWQMLMTIAVEKEIVQFQDQ